jgi:hypothetical protein
MLQLGLAVYEIATVALTLLAWPVGINLSGYPTPGPPGSAGSSRHSYR